jgi:hypothetical protein
MLYLLEVINILQAAFAHEDLHSVNSSKKWAQKFQHRNIQKLVWEINRKFFMTWKFSNKEYVRVKDAHHMSVKLTLDQRFSIQITLRPVFYYNRVTAYKQSCFIVHYDQLHISSSFY